MKTVIIEDEKAAVRNLTSLLNEVKPDTEIVAVLDSIGSTIEWFGSHPIPDLIFMDIHLADGSAFEIFNHIKMCIRDSASSISNRHSVISPCNLSASSVPDYHEQG